MQNHIIPNEAIELLNAQNVTFPRYLSDTAIKFTFTARWTKTNGEQSATKRTYEVTAWHDGTADHNILITRRHKGKDIIVEHGRKMTADDLNATLLALSDR